MLNVNAQLLDSLEIIADENMYFKLFNFVKTIY